MKYIPLSLFLCSVFFYTVVAQDCAPKSPITFSASQINEQSLQDLIAAKRLTYSETEVQQEMSKITQCNNQLEIKLQSIENEIAANSLKAQELFRFKDISALLQRIETLEKSRIDAQEELKKNISQVPQVGVYLVVLENIDPYDSKNDLLQKAKAALHPYAIEDLNGVSIRRLTEVASFESVKDIIESFVSGAASDRKIFVDQQNFVRKYFLYVAQVSVLPLTDTNLKEESPPSDGVFVMKLQENFEGDLLKKNISDDDIKKIKDDAIPYLELSQQENQNNRTRQQNIIEKGELEIKKTETDLLESRRLLNDRSKRIKKVCEEHQLRFEPNNLDASAQRAFDYFKQRTEQLDEQWKQLKEQELIPKQTITTIEGNPAASIAAESMKLYRTLGEQAGKISKTQERIRIEDFKVTDYEAKKDITLFRAIQRIWIYPVLQDNNTFKIIVFAKFKITASEEPSVSNFPIPETTLVKGGTFTMGCKKGRDTDCSDDEKPAHSVTLSDFYMGKYEVTVKEYLAFADDTKSNYPEWLEAGNKHHIETGTNAYYKNMGYSRNASNLPIVGISWDNAVAYCKWLSEKTGKNYRLPTEAEWEYAARGGQSSRNYLYAGSNNIDEVAWYDTNSGITTHAIGAKKANELGIYDMSGNVWEWCSDGYGAYVSTTQTNPTGDTASALRVLRGGSWFKYPQDCRVANRLSNAPSNREVNLGFRLAMTR